MGEWPGRVDRESRPREQTGRADWANKLGEKPKIIFIGLEAFDDSLLLTAF